MKRLLGMLALVMAATITAAAAVPNAEPLRIVAATTDVGAIARAVAGEDASIEVVARPDRDPHALEVRPSTLRLAAKADLYLEVGLALDLWSADIVRGSRNRHLVLVDCSQAITPLEVPTGKVDASMGDVHPLGNPHWWLDPENAVKVAELLAQRFGELRPERASEFERNAASFAQQVEARRPAWKQRLTGASFVEYHRSWSYFAHAFDVTIAGQVEPLPGIPPSGRHLALLADLIRKRRVPMVIRDRYQPPGPLEFLVRETGVESAVLGSACDEPTPASYLARFDRAAELLGSRRAPTELPDGGDAAMEGEP